MNRLIVADVRKFESGSTLTAQLSAAGPGIRWLPGAGKKRTLGNAKNPPGAVTRNDLFDGPANLTCYGIAV
jgi:hypothetical protein